MASKPMIARGVDFGLDKPMMPEGKSIFDIAFESAVGIVEKGKELLTPSRDHDITGTQVAATATAGEGMFARLANFISPQAPAIEEPARQLGGNGRKQEILASMAPDTSQFAASHNDISVPSSAMAQAVQKFKSNDIQLG